MIYRWLLLKENALLEGEIVSSGEVNNIDLRRLTQH